MKNIKIKYLAFLSILFVLIFYPSIKAQDLSLGADIVSRYIWRGIESGGNSPSIQPNISFSTGGFSVGFWGAFPTANPDALNEIDFYTGYAIDFGSSSNLYLGITDYMYPNSGVKIGNFNNYDDPDGPGAHYVEANAIYTGPESFPLIFSFNMFVYNVANNPMYFEVKYSTTVADVPLDLFIGGTPGDEAMYYGVSNFSIINTGFKVTKEIKITDSFSLPVFGSVILNPASEDLFYVLGITL